MAPRDQNQAPPTRRLWRSATALVCALALFTLSGAACPQMVKQYKLPVAAAQARALTLDELALRINEHSAQVQSLSSTSVTLSGPQFPSLKANLALERPQRFRLVAEKTGLTGPELDLGSNDELFWFWVKRSEPPAIYFCRHDQFATSSARQVFPVEPQWLLEALGLLQINPAEVTYGPAPVGGSRQRLELTLSGAAGARRKVIVFDDSIGAVVEQHMYDESGALLASALLSEHERDEATGTMLPREIRIQWPPTRFEMKIELADLQVNQLAGDPAQLWAKPEYRGWANVDLADPRAQLPPPTFRARMPEPAIDTATADRRGLFGFFKR